MILWPLTPGVGVGKRGGGGSEQGRRDKRPLWGPGDDTSPSPPPPPRRTRAPFSPGCRLPAAAGSRENRGTSPSHSPQPHPLPEGGSKVLAAGHGCSMSGCPRLYNPQPTDLARVEPAAGSQPPQPAGAVTQNPSASPDADVRAALVPPRSWRTAEKDGLHFVHHFRVGRRGRRGVPGLRSRGWV